MSSETAHQYFDVFSRAKFDRFILLETRLTFIQNIIAHGLPIEIKERIIACRDLKDDKFLSLALAANATCIITGDKDLLVLHPFRDIPILSATAFLQKV